MPTIEAGRPSAVWLAAPTPIPPETALTLWLRGPKTLRGVVAERSAPTVNIEARFAVRVAGEYTLQVEDASKRTLLRDKLRVTAGPAHTASCSLDPAAAAAGGRRQVLHAVDAFGNRHRSGGVRFLASFGAAKCSVQDEEDGTYVVQLPPSAPWGPGQLRVWQHARSGSAVAKEAPSGGVPLSGEGEVVELPIFVRRPLELPPASAACDLLVAPPTVGQPLEVRLSLLDKSGAASSPSNPAIDLRAYLGEQPVAMRIDMPPAFAAAAKAAAGVGTLLGSVVPRVAGSMTLRLYLLPATSDAHASSCFGECAPAAVGGSSQQFNWTHDIARSSIDNLPSARLILAHSINVSAPLATPVSAANSSATGRGLRLASAGERATLRLRLRDASGRPCDKAAHAPFVSLAPLDPACPASAPPPGRGGGRNAGVANSNSRHTCREEEEDGESEEEMRAVLARAAVSAAARRLYRGSERGDENSGACGFSSGDDESGAIEAHECEELRGAGEYELSYVPTRAGVYALSVHLPLQGKARSSSMEEGGGASVVLGPWRVAVLPARPCLRASLAAALLPVEALEVGTPLEVLVPLVDRYENAALVADAPGVGGCAPVGTLSAQLVRAVSERPATAPGGARTTTSGGDRIAVESSGGGSSTGGVVECSVELLRDVQSARALCARVGTYRVGQMQRTQPQPHGRWQQPQGDSKQSSRPLTAPGGGRPRVLTPSPSVQPRLAARQLDKVGGWPGPTGESRGGAPLSGGGATVAFARLSVASLPSGEWRVALSSADAASAGSEMAGVGGASAVSATRLIVQAGSLDASRCIASGSGITSATLGEPALFTITPCDGQPRGSKCRLPRSRVPIYSRALTRLDSRHLQAADTRGAWRAVRPSACAS